MGEESKTEQQLLQEQIAAIEAEEKAAAEAKALEEARNRVKKHAMKKELEAKGLRDGLDFMIVDGEEGLFFPVKKPDAVIWKAFSAIAEKTQPDWEKLYRACVPSDMWDKILHQVEHYPLGTEDRIVNAIMRMLGLRREARAKK